MLCDTQSIQHAFCLIIRIPFLLANRRGCIGKHSLLCREIAVLGQNRQFQPILPDDLPPVRLLLPGDNPKKRGLTRTVNPDDSHLFAFLNAAGDIIKDPFIPVQLTYVLYI